jgi:hypothetical protein
MPCLPSRGYVAIQSALDDMSAKALRHFTTVNDPDVIAGVLVFSAGA